MIKMFGYFLNTSANPAKSAFEYTAPLGLQGDENMKSFVLSVIAASSSSGVILYPFSMDVFTILTSPPVIRTISE